MCYREFIWNKNFLIWADFFFRCDYYFKQKHSWKFDYWVFTFDVKFITVTVNVTCDQSQLSILALNNINLLLLHSLFLKVNFPKFTCSNQIFRNFFGCIHNHPCKISIQIIEFRNIPPYDFLRWTLYNTIFSMVKPLVPWINSNKYLSYTILTDSSLTWLLPMKSCMSSNSLTIEKCQKVPDNLDNPKYGWNLEQGWALGNLPYLLVNVDSAQLV